LLFNSSHNTLLRNNISNSEGGIYLILSNDNEVTDNSAVHNEDGIYLVLSDNNALKSNTMSENRRNFGVETDLYIEIGRGLDNSIDTSNLVDGKPVYYMIGSFGSVIDPSSNAGTVYCISCNNITIRDLAFNNSTYGIFFFDTRDSRIENNSIKDCQTGILLFNSLNNTLQNNSITHNDHGIDLSYSGNNHLMNNTFNGNRRSFRVEGLDQEGILEDFDNRVDPSNLIDGKPIYYLVGASDQVINSSSRAGTVYCISCDNITVRDLELINNSHGIYLLNTGNSRIINNEINGNEDGIDLMWSDGNTIENNSISLNEDGVDLFESYDNRINGNSINYSRSGGGDGIYLASSSNNTLMDNNISHNEDGILIYSSGRNTLRNNTLLGNDYNFDLKVWERKDFDNDIDTSNLIDGRPIYYIREAFNLDINSSSNAGAIYCIGCENVTVRDLILNNSSHGVYFFETDNSRIENITARYNRISILLHYSRNNAVTGNKASDNIDGVDLWMSEDNNIIGNKIDHDNDAGISLFESDYNNLSLNEINDSHNCILLWYSSDHNIVKANNLTGKHADSLSVMRSRENLITGNIARESFNGIVLEEANGNIIDGNDATDNFNGHILINSSSNTLRDNLASRNIHGIAAYLSRDNIVAGNNASNNLESGIVFELSNRSAVSNNNVTTNLGHGVRFLNTNSSQIDNNSITGNLVGISIYNSSEDAITGNNISGNYVGIYLVNSRNVSLVENSNYGNSFDELQRDLLPLLLPQETMDGAAQEIIAEPLSLILFSPTHGGYSGTTPPGEIPPGETAAVISPPPAVPAHPTGDGDGGTGIPLQAGKPQPPDPLTAVEEALKYLREGRIIWNPPSEMELGRTETVVARITNDIAVNLTEGLRGRGVPQPEQIINTSCYMEIKLYGDNFKITSIMPDVQPVRGSGYTEWSWYVTPLESGEQKLTLVASIILVIDNKDRSQGLKPHEQIITVTVSPQHTVTEFLNENWKWLAATLVIPIITWLWRSRTQKKS
jgi:putative surface-exposed virulence protein